MADINHVISLGIGSPAAIPEFLTFGLQIGEPPTGSLDGTIISHLLMGATVEAIPLLDGNAEDS